ncbi:MAG: hypothetical protein LR008_00725 [Candidatus Pacebacteria bacterium]|nr:hypothetical protein [Candidatus Paceibacterota bacterium]
MQSKSLLIAIAAFAVTATGAYADNGRLLIREGLTSEQVSALEEARELRQSGDLTAARDLLVTAGIDETALKSIKRATKLSGVSVKEAVETNDYEAFKVAVENSPLADIVTSKSDFKQFVEAHELRQNGQGQQSKELLKDLGVDVKYKRSHHHDSKSHPKNHFTEEQREVLQVARQANDREAVHAIFDEAGVERPSGR